MTMTKASTLSVSSGVAACCQDPRTGDKVQVATASACPSSLLLLSLSRRLCFFLLLFLNRQPAGTTRRGV